MRRIALLLGVLSSIVAAAQQQPASADDIRRLVEVMHIRKNMVEMQNAMVDQYRPMIEKMSADMLSTLTPRQREKFNDILNDALSQSVKSYPPEEMLQDMLPIYQKYLEKPDVEAMITFYSSPTGQKVLDIQPKIIRDFMTVMVPKMQERMQEPLQKMQERIRDMAAEGQTQPAPDKEFKPATPAPK